MHLELNQETMRRSNSLKNISINSVLDNHSLLLESPIHYDYNQQLKLNILEEDHPNIIAQQISLKPITPNLKLKLEHVGSIDEEPEINQVDYQINEMEENPEDTHGNNINAVYRPKNTPKNFQLLQRNLQMRKIIPIMKLFDSIVNACDEIFERDSQALQGNIDEKVASFKNHQKALFKLNEEEKDQLDYFLENQFFTVNPSSPSNQLKVKINQVESRSHLHRLHRHMKKFQKEICDYYSGNLMAAVQKNQQYNLSQYLFALKAFMNTHYNYSLQQLVDKWILLSNDERNDWILEGLDLKRKLENKYRKDRLRKQMSHIQVIKKSGVNYEPLLQSTMASSYNQLTFRFDQLVKLIDQL